MYISKLKIKNFKCFEEVTIEFDPNFNLIIGENNSGKSTIFEALRLWQLAFNKFLKDRTNNQQSSFYAPQYFNFTLDDISFLRISDFKNLFFNKANKKFEISLTINNSADSVILPIIFTKTTEGQVLRFELCSETSKRPKASEELSKVINKPLGSNFKSVFLFTYINPLFLLPINEPYFEKGYITNKLHQAKANEVIRNLIYHISPLKKKIKKEQKDQKLVEIERSLKSILLINSIAFSKQLEVEDAFIKIFSKNEDSGVEVEINQLGSGTINVLNILSVLAYGDYEKFELNALLLDEPDSHLHSDHQKRLYTHLFNTSKDLNKQIFVITHNHELIDSSEKVIYVDKDKIKRDKKLNSISNEEYNIIYRDLSSDYYLQKLELIEKKKNDVILNSITKPTLFCEGTSDLTILKEAYLKLYNNNVFFNDMLDIQDAKGASFITNRLKYNSNDELFLIGLFDNDFEGNSQKKILLKENYKLIGDFHYQKFFNKDNNTPKKLLKNHFLLLPIPQYRLDISTYYEENGFIEYMFNDEVLQSKLKLELIEERGRTHKVIKTEKKGDKHNYSVVESEKQKVVENIASLVKEDFNYFIPLFEKIAKIINYTLPTNA